MKKQVSDLLHSKPKDKEMGGNLTMAFLLVEFKSYKIVLFHQKLLFTAGQIEFIIFTLISNSLKIKYKVKYHRLFKAKPITIIKEFLFSNIKQKYVIVIIERKGRNARTVLEVK